MGMELQRTKILVQEQEEGEVDTVCAHAWYMLLFGVTLLVLFPLDVTVFLLDPLVRTSNRSPSRGNLFESPCHRLRKL